MDIIYINNYEEFFIYLKNEGNNNNYQLVFLDYYFIHNMGIKLLKNIIDEKNINQKIKIIFNCKDSLSYTLFAIESKITYIIYECNYDNLSNLQKLANSYNALIFQSIEKSIEYFKNIY